MKRTLKERMIQAIRRLGRKNRILRFLLIPVLALCLFLFNVAAYLKGNVKRFSMVALSFFLFTVYCSFSFPMFIGSVNTEGLNDIDFEKENDMVGLAVETELDMNSVELIEDSDVMEGLEYQEVAHGLDVADTYKVDEILNEETNPGEISTAGQTEGLEAERIRATYTFDKNDWRLILINKQHSVPENYEVPLGTIPNTYMKCDERIIEDLLAMLQAAKEDGVNLSVCSPYRDLERQEMLFNRKINRYMGQGMSYMEAFQLSSQAVTVPGASEHQIGLALDIVCDTYTSLNEGFGDTQAGVWLAENSYKYGFILRYPKGKEYITCIEYEPWHFRYVGVEAATVITQEGITLEEFWEDL